MPVFQKNNSKLHFCPCERFIQGQLRPTHSENLYHCVPYLRPSFRLCFTLHSNTFENSLIGILLISPDPPEIVTPPVDQVVWVGQQVNLSCDAVGNPTPKIVYTVIGDNGIVGFEKTLVINSSSTPYVKTFTCNANNTIGPVAAANATITVLGKCNVTF